MIHFIGNQFKAVGPEGLYRARNFVHEHSGIHIPGIILGVEDRYQLTVVTFLPVAEHTTDTWGCELGTADTIVNDAREAAKYIGHVLNPFEGTEDHDFIFP